MMLRCLLLISLLVFGLSLSDVADLRAEPAVAEQFRYDLDFLFFKNLAEGELQMRPLEEGGVSEIILVGRTLGMAAWLTGDRTQTYRALVEETDSGALRSLIYESRVHKRKGGKWTTRSKRYRFDHAGRQVHYEKARDDGVFHKKEATPIPDGVEPVDMLTAFYNVRRGVYGVLQPGTQLRIPTFSGKGFSEITVDVVADDDPQRPGTFAPGGPLLRVTLDPEVFETGDGAIYVWFDAAGRPARGIVEDIIGLGDVLGRLRDEAKSEH